MMCSYQTISRYHEPGSTGGQASRIRKSLEDIRLDHRLAIHQARLKLKSSKMLKNRRIFTELLDSDSSDEDTYYDQDALDTTPTATPNSHLEYAGQANSSAWELSSQTSSCLASPSSEQDILAYFIESPSTSPGCSSSSSSQNSRKAHQPFRTLKELNRSTSSPKQKCTLDVTQTKLEFNTLKDAIMTHSSSSQELSLLIHSHTQALINPLRTFTSDELPHVLELLSSLIVQQSLQPETLLMILQQGLMIHICNVFARHDVTCDQGVLSVVTNIVNTYPAAVPFMIDSMTTSNFWNQLKTELQHDNIENALPRLQIFHRLTSFTLSQLFSSEPIQPLLPPVLLQTGVTEQTFDSYSPLNTLAKLYSTPEILILMREHCLEASYYNRAEVVTTVLQVFATTLQYVQVVSSLESDAQHSSNKSLVAKLLNALKGTDQRLAAVVTSLTRTVITSQYSEHSSQGIGTNASSINSLNHCHQFLSYYSQHYTPLAAKYRDLMGNSSDNVTRKLYKPLDL